MSQEDPSNNLDGVIARSRSRYRSNRLNQNVTSPHAPPKIRPEFLEEQKSGPRYAQEGRGLNTNTEADNIRAVPIGAAPSRVRAGIAEDEYNYSSTLSTSNRPAVVRSASSDKRSRTFPEAQSSQHRTAQHGLQRREDVAGMTRTGKCSAEDQIRWSQKRERGKEFNEQVASQELNAGQRVSRKDFVKSNETFKEASNQLVEEGYGLSNAQPFSSPPMPTESSLGEQRLSHTKSAPASHKPSTLQKRSLTHRRKATNSRDELKRSISAPMPVEPPEVINKPAFDAPVSAVNAGDRRVRVQLDQTPLSIAVTPSTTPLDILHEAGSQLSMPLDTTTNVLMECFKQLGLERPLRRYERIRDVMNSWDNDSQNSLSIVPSPTGGRDSDLDLNSVASTQPGDTSVHIYHSNSPGSWDKRWITLRSDGQVLMSKKDGKENVNICHVSDFDIYVPTKRQLAKKTKPPKKYCFAVKSQQKSAMFLSTENFVHFFAAGDRELAMAWYKAVQEWRSWYLVNVMGEGYKATNTTSIPQRPTNGYQSDVNNHLEGKSSIDHTYRQQPAGPGQTHQTLQSLYPKRLPTNHHGSLPVSLPKKLSKNATDGTRTTRNDDHYRASIIQQQPLVTTKPEPFAAQSLLGRSYTQRQKAVSRVTHDKAPEYGPSAYDSGAIPAPGSNGLQRRSTQRPQQQPLLDLTPKRLEPPQHRKKGIGFAPEILPVGGLVEAAINTDPTVTKPLDKGGAESRKPSIGHSQHPINTQPTASPEEREPAFTGGLLSSVQMQGQDGTGIGHGIKTGDRTAKEPLLDMTMEGPWAKGSLLDRVNSGESGSGRPVDREKRHEMNAPVGEGL